jgi:hypothetical protein
VDFGFRLLAACGFMLCCASANAQQPQPDTLGQRDPAARVGGSQQSSTASSECNAGLDLTRSELSDLSRHAGWGMFTGAVAGIAYGLSTRRGRDRSLVVTWNALVGAASGMTVGAGVYGARRLGGYKPPVRATCGRNASGALESKQVTRFPTPRLSQASSMRMLSR